MPHHPDQNPEPNGPILFLAIGDVHGHFDSVIEAIEVASLVEGRPPQLVFLVGDAEPIRDEVDLAGVYATEKRRSMGNFTALIPDDLGAPVYFIGGNHDPYPALDDTTGPYPCPWGESGDVYYLGRVGAQSLNGLSIAWISGIDSPGADPRLRAQSIREATFFSEDELVTLERQCRILGHVDVLITHEWASGLHGDRGSKVLRGLIERVQPSLQICGHLHRVIEANIGVTRVEALTAVPAVTKSQGRPRRGWWRLYERDSTGEIKCLRIGS